MWREKIRKRQREMKRRNLVVFVATYWELTCFGYGSTTFLVVRSFVCSVGVWFTLPCKQLTNHSESSRAQAEELTIPSLFCRCGRDTREVFEKQRLFFCFGGRLRRKRNPRFRIKSSCPNPPTSAIKKCQSKTLHRRRCKSTRL